MWRFCDITGRNRPVLSLHHSCRCPAKNAAFDTTYQYHLRVFMTTAYRQPTERGVHCLRPRFMPSRFAAVVGGPNPFRWPSWPGVARVSILVYACHRENSINSFRTAAASKSESARGSARNRPRALSQTGISKRHDQVTCRKARERSRVVVEPGAVVIATR